MIKSVYHISLNGEWEAGTNRIYDKLISVPGLAGDPKCINEGSLWYKKTITLPEGEWSHATLVLKGARFFPSIYVNAQKVSEAQGGMSTTVHHINSSDIRPGATIQIEIELKSLNDVEAGDASRIPQADLWRSNISSCLWDDVILKLHGDSYISRLIPSTDLINDCVTVKWEIEKLCDKKSAEQLSVALQVLSLEKTLIAETSSINFGSRGEACIKLGQKCKTWSPDEPNCYILKASLYKGGSLLDEDEFTLGLRDFTTEGLRFKLNHTPVTLRAGSVVWHRWLRDPEAEELAFDVEWFEKNIVKRLKSYGANTLRFHLGMPPEKFLDLCDRYGLLVQAEWIFFHGMKASKESLLIQWKSWMDLCMRHPSVAILHPWNETDGDELTTALDVIESLLPEYPPLVIGHKDVIHIHKYWWSLFENLGLYYDSADQFELPIMVDEFGGNYLDGKGMPGTYPTVKESLMRFLGRNHTKEMRLQLHRDSNAKVAEYWRRIGAAGYSPFCILGSPEDGNHHFMGALKDAEPKPVWDALAAVYSPLSCSLEVWDRNYIPGQIVELPLYFFNDTNVSSVLESVVSIVSLNEENTYEETVVSCTIPQHSKEIQIVTLRLPEQEGEWLFRAILKNPPKSVQHAIISEWSFRTLKVKIPGEITNKKIAVPDWEPELKEFFTLNGIDLCNINDDNVQLVVTGLATWDKISKNDKIKQVFEDKINNGCSIIMQNIGHMDLGQGYLPDGSLGPLYAVMEVKQPEITEYDLLNGIKVKFKQAPEPESCIHPTETQTHLWDYLVYEATWLWNGLRGGLIVPACDMEVNGLGEDEFITQWSGKGADIEKIRQNGYMAFELAGFYAFSNDMKSGVIDELRKKVQFLVEDAPALQNSINPDAQIKTYDLSELYKQSKTRNSGHLEVLVNCGKNLTRTPVIQIDFGVKKGKLLLSQLITNGRLVEGYGSQGLYGIRKDPATGQFLINMVMQVLNKLLED